MLSLPSLSTWCNIFCESNVSCKAMYVYTEAGLWKASTGSSVCVIEFSDPQWRHI